MPTDELPSIWRRTDKPRFLEIRLEVLQLFGYDEQTAKVASVLITRHNLRTGDLNGSSRFTEEPWFRMTIHSIRAWCLGMVSLKGVAESLKKIEAKGVLQRRNDGLHATTSYLLNAEALNDLLQKLPDDNTIPEPKNCPERRNGWEAKMANLSKSAGVPQTSLLKNLSTIADYKENHSSSEPLLVSEHTPIIPVLEPEQEALSRPEAVLEQEGSKKEEPADLPEELPKIMFDNNFDWVDNLVHAHGKSLGARPLEKEMTAFDALVGKLGGPEVTARLYVESEDRSLSAFIKSHGGFAAKSKSARAPAPQQQRISRNSASVTQRGRPSYSTQPSASNAQKQESGHTPETAAAVARWNELVPAKAVTLTGSVKGYSVDLLKGLCQDEEFMQGFDTICKKAAAQGPWCNFGWLPFDKQDGKGPNWGKLLRGELDGLGSAGGGFKANKFSRDSLRATAEADIARRAQL